MVLTSIKCYFNNLSFLKVKSYLLKKNVYRSFRNAKGQITVEIILLLSLFLFFTTIISTVLKDSEVAKTIIGKPWKMVSGMIESGTWAESNGDDIHQSHPVIADRQVSVRGQR